MKQDSANNPINIARNWFRDKGWTFFTFQQDCFRAVIEGENGLLNAPTGSGKTLALWLPFICRAKAEEIRNPHRSSKGIQVLWITPLRALAGDTESALQNAVNEIGLNWTVARRTGDSSAAQRKKLDKNPPQTLITTPETLHLMLSRSDHPQIFARLKAVIVDEWHELMGTKRGVQTELALSRLRGLRTGLQVWGISATIGNLEEAADALIGTSSGNSSARIIRADIRRKTEIHTLLPDTVDRFPWAGHIGIRLLDKLLPVIRNSRSTLLFTNTRSMTEIWYQALLNAEPDLAGQMAIHHSSLNNDTRRWVEQSLHEGGLKLVICTSSLDLGVDFAPVETVIQVGSPKGVARFMQRAGRSGHQPGAESRIWFVPTHALEILDAMALREAIRKEKIESREPLNKPLDVLIQYICTLAVGLGCSPNQTLREIRSTATYRNLSDEEWEWCLQLVTHGGPVLSHYDDYAKVGIASDGSLHISDRRTAVRHRMSIGTITSDAHLSVRFLKGGRIGSVEESFIARMKPGDVFLFAGRYLEFVRLKDMVVYVKKSNATKGAVSRWMGARMLLSSRLADEIRHILYHLSDEARVGGDFGKSGWDASEIPKIKENGTSDLGGQSADNTGIFTVSARYRDLSEYPEARALEPLLQTQQVRSALPSSRSLLVEQLRTREGWHHFFFPIEGRVVHEGLSSLIAWRIGQRMPISFSIAMNDYGFELLSDQPVPEDILTDLRLYSPDNLQEDMRMGVNAAEMAKRQFREIARVSGLVFQGYPGRAKVDRHIQANSSLLFDVFQKYDPENLLVRQAYDEILDQQIGKKRLEETLRRIQTEGIRFVVTDRFTPFSFPIMVDRLRGKMSSEKLEDRIKKMYAALVKD